MTYTRAGILLTLCLLFPLLASAQRSEDEITTQNSKYVGTIQGSTTQGISIRITGSGNTIRIPHSAIVDMRINQPPMVVEGIKAYDDGNMPVAARVLQRFIEQYQGLDTDWAIKGLLYYASASLEIGDFVNAEKGFVDFMKWYPANEEIIVAEIGMAKIDVAQSKTEEALEKLGKIAEQFDAQLKPSPNEIAYAADTYLSLGKCHEAMGDDKKALDSYMTVVALYPVGRIYPEAVFRSATLFFKFENFDRAEEMFTEIMEKFPRASFASTARRERDSVRIRKEQVQQSESE